MELVGKNLYKLLSFCDSHFTIQTICLFGIEALELLEHVHSKGIIHRDIKPQNFTIGTGSSINTIYLLDFGLAKSYIDKSGKHKPYSNRKGFTGTIRYASYNAQRGFEQSRRDDLESLGYLFVYFYKGSLPWSKPRASTPQASNKWILNKKVYSSFGSLCRDMPGIFIRPL